jgi:predicted ATPase/DNA-binding SARP family transcriptional activator
MEFQILGPLRVVGDRSTIELSAALERALLLRLLLTPNRPVTVAQLIDDLWAGDPPRTAVRTLRVYVSRLRQALGEPERILTTSGGYELRVNPGECDAERFETLSLTGHLASALDLWRGRALADVADAEWARIEAGRLEERRLTVLEERLREDLTSGGHAEIVAELEALCAREPLREGLWASLMLALYRPGRQADALAAYARLRSHLVSELGLEPSRELRALQAGILSTDPELDLSTVPPPRTGPVRPPDATPGATSADPTHGDSAIRGNVHAARTSFISGTLDVGGVADLLATGRPLSLVGPPGAGKTRMATELALAVEPRYPGGAWMVELAALSDGTLLAARVADTVALAVADGAPGSSLSTGAGTGTAGGEPLESLIDHFRTHAGLLVLDNCEHLTASCAGLVEQLTTACPDLALVCTSRERLDVDQETIVSVPLLAVPDAGADSEEILASPACRLFVDRAALAGAGPDLSDAKTVEAIAEICRRLDGLPLALELAAARTGVMSPMDIAIRLDDGLELLRSRRDRLPERQRTLRALLELSHSMLADSERRLLRRLAVFAGGASLDAVERVCAGLDLARTECLDGLEMLAERSLIVADTAGHARYRLLETIRLYGLEQLRDAGEEDTVRDRHAQWCIEFATTAHEIWLGGDQQRASRLLAAERDNWSAALNWLIARGDGERATQLAAPLGQWWYASARTHEGRPLLEAVLSLSAPPSHERATVLRLAGALSRMVGDLTVARRHIADGIAIAEAVGDRSALLALQISLGGTTWLEGDLEAAAVILAQALDTAHALGDRRAQGNLSYNLSVLARNAGELDEALARITFAAGAWSDAGDLRGVALARGLGASVQVRRGEREDARQLLGESLSMLRGTEFAEAIVEQIETAVTLACADQNYELAAQLLGHAEAIREAEQLVRPPFDEAEAEQLLGLIREQLGGQTEVKMAAGVRRSLDQAIDLALRATAATSARASERTR